MYTTDKIHMQSQTMHWSHPLHVCSWNQEVSGMKVEGARGKLYSAPFAKFKMFLEAMGKTNHQPCIILHWVAEGTEKIACNEGTGSSSMS